MDAYWSKVTVRGPDECWPWTGARAATGHGSMGVPGKNTTTTAQRVGWTLAHGPIPPGMVVRHTCDNPPCQNPAHLILGTRRDNTQDAIKRSEAWANRICGKWRTMDLDVDEIRRRVAVGESQQSVADALGIGQTTVSRVVRHADRFSH